MAQTKAAWRQILSSFGSAGQALFSNGSGADPTFGDLMPAVVIPTAGNVNLALTTGRQNTCEVTTAGNLAINVTSTGRARLLLRVTLGGAHTVTVTHNGSASAVRWRSDTAPTLTGASGNVLVFDLFADGTKLDVTNWYTFPTTAAASSAGTLVKTVTATTYTLQASDNQYTIYFSAATPVTVRIPASLYTFGSDAFRAKLYQQGAGTLSVLGNSGVTVNSINGSNQSAARYARLEVLQSASNEYVLDGQLSGTVITDTITPQTLLIDALGGKVPTIAVSVRKLRTAYTGSALRVRRSSDSAVQDFGFVNDILPVSSMQSFTGSSGGKVPVWYNQGSKGGSFSESGAADIPTIITSGSVELYNTKPALKSAGTANMLLWGPSWQNATTSKATIIAVLAVSGYNPRAMLVGSNANTTREIYYNDPNTGEFQYSYYETRVTHFSDLITTNTSASSVAAIRGGSWLGTTPVTANTLVTIAIVFDSVNMKVYRDGILISTSPSSGNFEAAVNTSLFGTLIEDIQYLSTESYSGYAAQWAPTQRGANPWKGSVSELLIFDQELTTTELAIVQANQKAYFATA